MDKIDSAAIAEMVREFIRDRHPDGVTIEVVEQEISLVDSWWHVPVRPNFWPKKTSEYFMTLAEVEGEIQEARHLNILLAPVEPVELEAEQAA